jgi:hypothetical protein
MDEIRPGLERELRGRGGWCARVTAGGTVQAGDRVSVAYLNDSPCVVAFRAAMAEWEASSVDARRGVGLTAQLPGVIDDLQLAFGRICGSSTAVTPPEAGMASGNTLWEQHDEWSTAVLEGARTSPEAADDALADLIERYRMLAGA